jgi:hypothetical protein
MEINYADKSDSYARSIKFTSSKSIYDNFAGTLKECVVFSGRLPRPKCCLHAVVSTHTLFYLLMQRRALTGKNEA